MKYQCKICGKEPKEISEYCELAEEDCMTPDNWVAKEEGTFNFETGKFYCTECYVKIGMPLGTA